MVPAFEAFVRPAWNRQELVWRRKVLRVAAKPRGDQLPDNLLVKCVAGDGHTVVADDVLRRSAAASHGWADVQNGKIARASSEVADEDELVPLERLFVAVRR